MTASSLMERQIEALAEEAVAMYAEHAVLNPTQVDEVRKDFRGFYRHVAASRLRGIRWNFDDCLLCSDKRGYAVTFRILIIDPRVVAAAGGRALGTILCPQHVSASGEEQVAAALKRIRDAPPRPGPAGKG